MCPRQAFPNMSNVWGKAKEPILKGSTGMVLHLDRLWPYSQILDWAGKACQGKRL
jgi:hypothetical protein